MLDLLQSESFLSNVLVVLAVVVGGSHGIIYLLSIVGLLLRPFWRRPVTLLYPWVFLTKPLDDIAKTPFRPSNFLLIHALWLTSSVSLWVGFTLYGVVIALNEIIPDVVGLDPHTQWGMRVPAWLGLSIEAMYLGLFASLSSWMWLRSLRSSRAQFRRMNGVKDDGGHVGVVHYLAPFRKATIWATAALPIFIGLLVLDIVMFPPFQG